MVKRKRSRNVAGRRGTRKTTPKPKRVVSPRGDKVIHVPWVQMREPFSSDTTLEDAVGLNYINRKVDPRKEGKKGNE